MQREFCADVRADTNLLQISIRQIRRRFAAQGAHIASGEKRVECLSHGEGRFLFAPRLLSTIARHRRRVFVDRVFVGPSRRRTMLRSDHRLWRSHRSADGARLFARALQRSASGTATRTHAGERRKSSPLSSIRSKAHRTAAWSWRQDRGRSKAERPRSSTTMARHR